MGSVKSPDATFCLNLSYIKIYLDEEVNTPPEGESKNPSGDKTDSLTEDKKDETLAGGETNTGDSAPVVLLVTGVAASMAAVLVLNRKKKTIKE